MGANLRPCFPRSDKACSFLLSLGADVMRWYLWTCMARAWKLRHLYDSDKCAILPPNLSVPRGIRRTWRSIHKNRGSFANRWLPWRPKAKLFPSWSSCRLARAQQRFSSFEAWQVTATWSSGASICGTLRCWLRKSSPICICWRCLYSARSFACSWLISTTQTIARGPSWR